MPDVATLGIKVEAGQAIQQTDQLTASIKRLSTGADQSVPYVRGLGQASTTAGRQMAQMEIEAYKLDAAMQQGAKSTQMHGLQMGRLVQESGTAAGRLLGLNTAATRLAATIGGNILGFGEMLAAMVAIGGVMWIWEKIADGAKKDEDALKSLREEIKKNQEALGDLALAAATAHAATAEAAYANAKSNAAGSGPDGGVDPLFGRFVASRKKALDEANALLLQAQLDKTAIDTKIKNEAEQSYAENLALLVSHNVATADERSRALALYKKNSEEIAKLSQSQTDNVRRAMLVGENDTLKSALFPKSSDIAALQLAVDKQIAMNAAVHEGATARALLASAYDREIELARNAKSYHGEELAMVNALTNAKYNDTDATIKRTEAERQWQNLINRNVQAARDEYLTAAEGKQKKEEETKATLSGVAAVVAAIAARGKALVDQAAKDIATAQKYSDDMNAIFNRGFNDLLRHGLDSWSGFFESVFKLFTNLMDRMAKEGKSNKLLNLGATALGGGMAGYQLGQQFGTAGGVLGGAGAGALMGSEFGPLGTVIGGLAGAAGGLLGASAAQAKAAEMLQQAAQAFSDSKTAYVTGSYGNSVADRLRANQQQANTLALANGDLFSKGGISASDADKNAQDISDAFRRNAAKISDDFFTGLFQQLNALNGPGGNYLNQLGAINKQYEENKAAATALGASEDELATVEKIRTKSIAQLVEQETRRQRDLYDSANVDYLTAKGDPEGDKLAREYQKRAEIEALVAAGASDATIEMRKQAQAAQDVAKATADAAAAMAKQIEAQRQFEDLQVRLLSATGNQSGADDLSFQLKQQRELEDAQKNNTADYVEKLKKVQQAEADSRAADKLIGATTGPSSAYGSGAKSAMMAVQATVTERTALMIVDLHRAGNTTLDKIEVNTRGGGSGGGGTTYNLNFRIAGDLTPSERDDLADVLIQRIQELSGDLYASEKKFSGSVAG